MQYEETGRVVTMVRILSSGNLSMLEDSINKFIEDKTGVEIQLMPDSVTPYYTALITYREYVES